MERGVVDCCEIGEQAKRGLGWRRNVIKLSHYVVDRFDMIRPPALANTSALWSRGPFVQSPFTYSNLPLASILLFSHFPLPLCLNTHHHTENKVGL